MKICIITTRHVSYNPRVVKEADALAHAGHEVTVVAIRNHSEQELFDDVLIKDKPWRLLTVNQRKSRIMELVGRLWSGLRQKVSLNCLSGVSQAFGIAERAVGREFPELRRLACSVWADLYVAHHADVLAAACAAAKRCHARLAFDAEDFHSGMYPVHGVSAPEEALQKTIHDLLAQADAAPKCRHQQCVEYLERKYLPRCDYLTAASDGIAEAYVQKYNLPRPATILNVFPLEERLKVEGLRFKEEDNVKPETENLKPLKLYWYSQVMFRLSRKWTFRPLELRECQRFLSC